MGVALWMVGAVIMMIWLGTWVLQIAIWLIVLASRLAIVIFAVIFALIYFAVARVTGRPVSVAGPSQRPRTSSSTAFLAPARR